MIKPLLRTIPTLSGNVKLACTLLDYNKINKDTFETNIRGAHIYPLSSQLFQKSVQANLLNSSWEYDLKKFYSAYADTFFEPCFEINKTEITKLDKTSNIYARNTDFEYGTKRISYIKSGNQYAIFAPIYIDNVKDIPSYFLIKLTISSEKSTITKNIRVNIGINKDDEKNYIYKYLHKYISKIDDNVAFVNNYDNTVLYYGIDLKAGGFTKRIDSSIKTLFNTYLPIQLFDYTLSSGFSRNGLCMKQCLPLCFYFDIDNILTTAEKDKFQFAQVIVSGEYYKYYNSNYISIPWYDFDWDYTQYTQSIKQLNINNGAIITVDGYSKNILNMGFPSLFDSNITNYQYNNKLTTTFGRWKLKYSSDEYPYITNMSWAFSNNQDSNYKYREYPVSFINQSGYAVINDKLKYNLIFPIGNTKYIYDLINPNSAKKYESIMDNYCLSWFDVLTDNMGFKVVVDDENDSKVEYSLSKDVLNKIEWADVNDGYSYYNGVLYNINKIYEKVQNISDADKIDKFAVLIYPNTDNIIGNINNLVFSKYSIKTVSDITEYKNCSINFAENPITDLYNITAEYNGVVANSEVYNEIQHDDINYSEISEKDELYINVLDLNDKTPYHKLNKIYDLNELQEIKGISKPYINPNNSNATNDVTIGNVDAWAKAFKEAVRELFQTAGTLTENYDEKYNLGINYEYTEQDTDYEVDLTSFHVFATAFLDNSTDKRSYNALPIIFKETPGKELYSELPVYILEMLLTEYTSGGITPIADFKSNFAKRDDIFINSSTQLFKPIKCSEFNEVLYDEINAIKPYEYTLFYKSTFVNSCFYNDLPDNIDRLITYRFFVFLNDNGYEYNINGVYIDGSAEAKIYEIINKLYIDIKNACLSIVSNIENNSNVSNIEDNSEDNRKIVYEYLPINSYENKIVSTNICKPYPLSLSNNDNIVFGDNQKDDNNVLFVHAWNLINIFGEDKLKEILPTDEPTECYCKVLNKTHLLFLINILTKDNNNNDKLFYTCEKVLDISKINATVSYDYEPIDDPTELYKYEFDEHENLFYYDDGNQTINYINIVCKLEMYKVTEDLLKDVGLLSSDNAEHVYTDLFLYRPLSYLDYDKKFKNTHITINIENNTNITSDILLYPCFNDIQTQEVLSTVFYQQFTLDDYSTVEYVQGNDTKILYRYNCPNTSCLIRLPDAIKINPAILTNDEYINWEVVSKLYKKINNDNFVTFYKDNNSLDKYADTKLNVIHNDDDDKNYGCIVLNVNVTNTNEFFNITGISSFDVERKIISGLDEVSNLKLITYINNTDIYENRTFIQEIFRQLCPFLHVDLIQQIIDLKITIVPTTFNLTNVYSTKLLNANNQSTERNIIYNKQSITTAKKQILQRYTNNITPYIKKTSRFNNLYFLKYKTVDDMLLETGKYNSIGDSTIYSTNCDIHIPPSINIYGISDTDDIKSYNNVIETFKPFEYKFYDNSILFNLPKELEYSDNKLYMYDDLLIRENNENTINVFSKLVHKYIKNAKNDDLILFLYKKYKVNYVSHDVGTNIVGSNKVYKLIYKFTLL